MWRYVKRTSPSRSRPYSGGDRLLDLEQELGLAPDVIDRHDAGARRASYAASGNALPSPAPVLDEHVVAALDELARAGRRQRDAVLVGLDLLGDADLHLEPRNLTFSTLSAHSRCTHARFSPLGCKPEGGTRPAPEGCPEGSRLREALDELALLWPEPRRLAGSGVLADVSGRGSPE